MPDREKVIRALECLTRNEQGGTCNGCAYFRPFENDPDTGWCDRMAAMADALAMLLEQEKAGWISAEEKTGARLMSREDMKKLKGYTPIWEETFNLDYGTELLPAIVGHGEVVTVEGTFDLDAPWIFETEYTKIRYWDAKPTEEERKAEPWPEEVTV